MSTTTTTAAPAANPVVEPEATAPVENAAEVSFFDQFSNEEDGQEKTREDIVSEMLLKPNVKKMTGLHIKNVVFNNTRDVPFYVLVLKEYIIGDTRNGAVDAFGIPEVTLGKTHNCIISAYALSAVMKDNPRTAVFAARVAEGSDFANDLFAGGTLDILMEYVAAGETYINPFSSNGQETVFDRDHVLCHPLAITMGEVGRDVYTARINRI
nr:MAG TPA: hypothetical protein [Crassvirales sp.]